MQEGQSLETAAFMHGSYESYMSKCKVISSGMVRSARWQQPHQSPEIRWYPSVFIDKTRRSGLVEVDALLPNYYSSQIQSNQLNHINHKFTNYSQIKSTLKNILSSLSCPVHRLGGRTSRGTADWLLVVLDAIPWELRLPSCSEQSQRYCLNTWGSHGIAGIATTNERTCGPNPHKGHRGHRGRKRHQCWSQTWQTNTLTESWLATRNES